MPELATRYLDKVETLGEILGQVHDLDCAAATAERHPRWFGSDADCEAVRGLVAEHRVALEREAFALAAGRVRGAAARRARAGRDRLGDLAQRASRRQKRSRTDRRPDGVRAAARRRDGRGGGVLASAAAGEAAARPRAQHASYRDGHTRPRALAFNPDDGLLYVALSTSDEIAVVDPAARAAARAGAAAGLRFPGRDRGAAGRWGAGRVPLRSGLRRVRRARGAATGA